MESKTSIVNNPERIYIVGYKLETKEDFNIAVKGLHRSMQTTLDVLALNGHYERMITDHPNKSTEDATLMNFVLGELRLIGGTRPSEIKEKVVKKTTRRKRSKQEKISFE